MEIKQGLVHFCHGKESGPRGIKIQRLANVAQARGYLVESLDYSGIDSPQARVEKLLQYQSPIENLILVGSSMGGYVATVASTILSPKGIFLLAPAFYLSGFENLELSPKTQEIEIVHGWRDEIIPPANSFRFAQAFKAQLHLVDGDHRLENQIGFIESLFELFLRRMEGVT
jgi:predicted esterase